MIKRILLTLVQFILFAFLLGLGGNWDAVDLALEMHALQQHKSPSVLIPVIKYPVGSHILIANGLLFATVLLLLILIFLLLRKKLHPWAWLSILAYALAVCIAMFMKVGLPPADSPAQSRLLAPYLTPQDASPFLPRTASAAMPIERA